MPAIEITDLVKRAIEGNIDQDEFTEELQKRTWGGKRPGAGAKPLPPEEKARKTAITLSPDIFAKLEAASQETGKSRSKLIEEALRKFL